MRLTYQDKSLLYHMIDCEDDMVKHPHLKLVNDTGWYKDGGWDSSSRDIEITDGTGFYKLHLNCGGDPSYDPFYHWECLPDEIKPYKGVENDGNKRKYEVHAKQYTVYATYEVWASSEAEARELIEDDPGMYEIDSEADDNFEILSAEVAEDN